jgi:serine/threonine-protein kinase HipA
MNETNASLDVLLHGILAGRLETRGEGSSFALSPEYIELVDRPILGQIFEDAPERMHQVRQGVPPWFANLLPEGAATTGSGACGCT